MKPSLLLRFILTIGVLAPGAYAKPPQITFAGGDGSSMKKAIVIKGATEETGVHAEYEYLEKHYPGCKRGGQALLEVNGKAYDTLEFTTADGTKKTLYFDITAFLGK